MRVALIILVFVALGFAVLVVWDIKKGGNLTKITNPKTAQEAPKPLIKYTIENLTSAKFEPSQIEIGDVLKDDSGFVSRYFYFDVSGRRVSGQINYPKVPGTYPVIVMNRGYIDRETYKTGDGTRRSGEVFAKNGFITVAPDFLGYGQSDMPSGSPLEERFQTYITSATLLESVGNLNSALLEADTNVKVDPEKIGIWGHSNGGQISLTVLEATGATYPTVLWAPVSKPFPYSILYYTDDIDDHGKMLRKVVSDFEKDYDSEKYSLTNYLDRINAPIQIHQGGADEAVPVKWSDDLVKILKEKDKDITYFTYPGDDHNFARGSWQTVVERNIEFFKEELK